MSREPETAEQVAQRLKAWRGDRSQLDLAKATNTTPQTISDWENEKVPRAALFLAALARDGCDINWLLTGRPKKNGQ